MRSRALGLTLAALALSDAPTMLVAADTPATGAKASAVPDFSSGRKMWVLASGTAYEKIPGDKGPGPITGTNNYRPKIIDPVAVTDNPLLQPWAKRVMDAANQKVLGGELGFNAASRCYPGGVPGILLFPGAHMEVVQTDKEVWLLWKRDAQIRRIYLNVPHSKNPGYSWRSEERRGKECRSLRYAV